MDSVNHSTSACCTTISRTQDFVTQTGVTFTMKTMKEFEKKITRIFQVIISESYQS